MSPINWLVCSSEGGGMMHPAIWLIPTSLISLSGYWNENLYLETKQIIMIQATL